MNGLYPGPATAPGWNLASGKPFGPGSAIAQPARIEVPTGVSLFRDPNGPPRELVEPWYDLRSYTRTERGGHFPALENPDALVRELRDFFRPLRSG